jgi:hypothetical protein
MARLRDALALVTAGAGAALGVAWFASGYWDLTWARRTAKASSTRQVFVSIRRGCLEVGTLPPGSMDPKGRSLVLYTVLRGPSTAAPRDWWFTFRRGSGGLSGRGWWIVAAPVWLPAAPCAAIGLWLPLKAWRRRRGGCCVVCGYSLAGNTTGICPECGTSARKET